MLKPVAIAAALVLSAAPALAHPRLVDASPAPDARVAARPVQLRLVFSEPVFPAFSGVVLKDAAGKAVATGPAALDPADKRVLVVPLKGPLAKGTWTVEWRAVAGDTHRITGKYQFTVS